MNQSEQSKRIEKLERQVARLAAEAIPNLSVASVEQRERIEKLEIGIAKGTTDLTGIINDICGRIEELEAASEADTIAALTDHVGLIIKRLIELERRVGYLEQFLLLPV